jgi:hypothetical protein
MRHIYRLTVNSAARTSGTLTEFTIDVTEHLVGFDEDVDHAIMTVVSAITYESAPTELYIKGCSDNVLLSACPGLYDSEKDELYLGSFKQDSLSAHTVTINPQCGVFDSAQLTFASNAVTDFKVEIEIRAIWHSLTRVPIDNEFGDSVAMARYLKSYGCRDIPTASVDNLYVISPRTLHLFTT